MLPFASISEAMLYAYGSIVFDHDSHKTTGDEHAFIGSQSEIVSNRSLITEVIYSYIVWMYASLSTKPHSTLNPDMSDPYTGLTQDDINNILYDYSYLYHSYSDLMKLLQITGHRCDWYHLRRLGWVKGRLQGSISLLYLRTYKLAVIAYDAVLSFQQEIKCIWGRKPGAGTILYLFIRYGTIIAIVDQIVDRSYVFKTVLVSNITPRDCKTLTRSFQR